MSYYIETPTEDMWEHIQQVLIDAGIDKSDELSEFPHYKTERNIGFSIDDGEPDVYYAYDGYDGECLTYSEFMEKVEEHKRIVLNDEHSAVVSKEDKKVYVGCQTFSFDVVEKLYKACFE